MILSIFFLISPEKSNALGKHKAENLKVCYNSAKLNTDTAATKGIEHKKIKRWLNGKPAVINIITFNPDQSKAVIKPTYGGEYLLNSVKKVRDFASGENAIAAVNASFFKPDIGAPLGVSVIDGEILTGPIYNRVVFGITGDNKFLMDKLDIIGKIKIGENLNLNLYNFNQPVFSQSGYTVFTDRWGEKTPSTPITYCQIAVKDNKILLIKQSSIKIPKNGYVLVGPRKLVKGRINKDDKVRYSMKLTPAKWKNVEYAIGGGPYLVKNGKIFIDRQKFSDKFLWKKEPRTAIGYSKSGTLILVTIDGRRKGISEGATISELAKIMRELGAYNAMNLDGGSSTQMVYKGKLVNMPTIRGGGKVTNALLIVPANIYPK